MWVAQKLIMQCSCQHIIFVCERKCFPEMESSDVHCNSPQSTIAFTLHHEVEIGRPIGDKIGFDPTNRREAWRVRPASQVSHVTS